MERDFSSLAGCYVLLASLAALFLVYARIALMAHSPGWSDLTLSSPADVGPRLHQLVESARTAAFAFRERMHTTWLFFGVFAAVWLACLLWMQIQRSRRDLIFTRHEAAWIGLVSLAVLAAAILYGVGTNGILAQRFPRAVNVSDVAALAFMLALPLVAWSRLHREERELEEEDFDEAILSRRNSGFLGLDDDHSNARLMENLSRLEVRPEIRPVDLPPAAATRLTESAEQPAPGPSEIVPQNPIAPVPEVVQKPLAKGIDGFRNNLSTMIASWQRIEVIRAEIDDWHELRRQQAIAHLDTHPGMRGTAIAKDLFQDFPNDKLAAVDSEWAEIRKSALEISRWFGDDPATERSN